MKTLPLISVVVPVYNVKQYLDQCVQSIVSQSYGNLEIILVDDGSTDGCDAICDSWAITDSRIKVVHKKNGGLSDARNAGMAIARGEFIGFIDSDDYISNDMYELLYNNLKENNSDISACGIELFWDDGTPSRMLTKKGCCLLNTEQAIEAVVNESFLIQPVVYKLYKHELVKDILFPVGKFHEDVYWTYQAIGAAKTVSVFDTPCYFYRQRSGSIMGTKYSIKRLDALEGQFLRLKFIESNFPALINSTVLSMWFSCIYTTQMLIRYAQKEEKKIGFEKINNILRAYPIKPFANKNKSFKQLIWLFMAKISIKATCTIRNALNIGF